jgi:hypothetical protein
VEVCKYIRGAGNFNEDFALIAVFSQQAQLYRQALPLLCKGRERLENAARTALLESHALAFRET